MLRPLRRYATSLVLVAPLGLLAGAQGCSDEAPVENLCTWLEDSSNCAARFAEDVGTQCGQPWVPDAPPTGEFYNRDALDMCVLDAGGLIVFDPPLSPAAFPPAGFSFSIVDDRAETCALGSYASPLAFTIALNSFSATGGDTIAGGVYSSTMEPGRDAFDVTCPGGQESHHFNQLMLEKCPDAAAYLPQAVVEANAGAPPRPDEPDGTGTPGYVRLRVVYPPANPAAGGEPVVVEYANCAVPAPPHPCADGVLNFSETDIDCGGNRCLPCEPGQRCVTGTDCTTGQCGLDAGLRVCLE